MRQTLVSWAVTSSFLILAVIALRAALGKRTGAALRYALWGLVLLRLLVPVQLFSSPVLGTVIDSESTVTRETQTVREAPDAIGGQDGPAAAASAVPVLPSPPDLPEAPDAPDWREIPTVLGWVWLAGGIVMALVLLGCNLRFWGKLRRTRRLLEGADCPVKVYTAESLPSPCLFGVLCPAIYVSPETAADPAALRHVLAHEGTHASHGDHIWSLLRCAALCVHWWNPLVWLAAKLSRRDGELACDEGALKRLGDGERAAYGNTLLALVTAKAAPGGVLTCSTAMTGDKKSLTERFARIAKAPKRAAGIGLAVVVLAALMTVCAFGQKTEASAPWEKLDAELSISMEDDAVRITGTVDGVRLARQGAFWHPGGQVSLSGSPYGELSLVYPAFTDGIEGQLFAWWADEEHTAVNLSTWMMAMLSSFFHSGYWEFTVDFSNGEAVVTRMEAVPGTSPDGGEAHMYPKAISDEEAVRAGRIAARLLTEAEAFYRDETGAPVQTPEEPARAELKAALLGETDFTLYRENSTPITVDITTAPPRAFDALSEEWEKYNSFAVVDLDGDGTQEVVYHITDVAGDAGGYLILRRAGDGDVRCYVKSLHTTRELKADGSFDFGYLGAAGSARLSFPEPGTMFREEPFLTYWMDLETGEEGFQIGGETVTRQEYDAARQEQDEKPDAVWYDFTPENIQKALG